VVEQGEVACPFVYPSAEASWRAAASAGPNQLAIAHSGEAASAPPWRKRTELTLAQTGAPGTRTCSSGRRASGR